jgi:hypothetical protein
MYFSSYKDRTIHFSHFVFSFNQTSGLYDTMLNFVEDLLMRETLDQDQ